MLSTASIAAALNCDGKALGEARLFLKPAMICIDPTDSQLLGIGPRNLFRDQAQ
jgi:hypothetical protein